MLCALLSAIKVCIYCHFHLQNFIVSLITLFLACNSFFFATKSSRELSNHAFFPRILNSKATVFFCFHLKPVEENGDFICYEMSGTILSSVSAFCFMQFHVGCFEMLPDHVRLVSATARGSGRGTPILDLTGMFVVTFRG